MFKHFGVCFTHELLDTQSVPVLTPSSLKHIHFFQTSYGKWKFVEEMTPEEVTSVSRQFGQHVNPRANSPSITPPPSILGQVMDIDERLYELQETADRLDYILV